MQCAPFSQFVYTTFVVTTSTSSCTFVLTTFSDANHPPPLGLIHVFVTTPARAAIPIAAMQATKANLLIFCTARTAHAARRMYLSPVVRGAIISHSSLFSQSEIRNHPSLAAIASAWTGFTPASSANDRQRETASRTSPMIFRAFDAERSAIAAAATMSSSVMSMRFP